MANQITIGSDNITYSGSGMAKITNFGILSGMFDAWFHASVSCSCQYGASSSRKQASPFKRLEAGEENNPRKGHKNARGLVSLPNERRYISLTKKREFGGFCAISRRFLRTHQA